MMRGLRRLFPDAGLRYSLFDSGILVAGLSLLWYVTTTPGATTTEALSATLGMLLLPQVFGWTLCIAGGFAVVTAYLNDHWVKAGYIVLACACGGWSASLFLGVAFSDVTWVIAGKTMGSGLLFGWIARGLISDVTAYGARLEPRR